MMVKSFAKSMIVLIGIVILISGCSKVEQKSQWVIGFSQVTVKEPWRVVFNENLKKKAAEYGEKIDLLTLDADDKTENQVEHIKIFIAKGVDAILISPKEASGCSKAIKEATEAGIPVIVLDRDVTYKGYAAYIGADNYVIGIAAATYAVEILGGVGKASGTIYEVCGSLASTPGQERRDGFHEVVSNEPGIKMLGGLDSDWKLDKAKEIVQDALQIRQDIDIIYAHNDPMAYGSYHAAKEMGLEKKIHFFGIDGLPHEGSMWVKNNILTATFLYPTPGEKGLEVAMEILSGKKKIIPGERIILPTETITLANVDQYLN